ncbi:diguanylate cyclase [Halomonas sp. M5N1S17]|uniref:sensor domain-containing diguanylate cyclase n=1 Tax=Halomonas alkalisoli TaxID=2907158 RepID=UPI001F469E01|nr:sensor domain-containing diguanylate cyclase [Halomonas alkalisoli]MCE9664993.1 diguanylate cyclase [Halomonas alkalisoli]
MTQQHEFPAGDASPDAWDQIDASGSPGTLVQSLKHFYTAVEHSPMATAITDPSGRLLYVNHRFVDITGYSRDELIGQTSSLIKSGKTSPETYRQLWQTLKAGNIWRGEMLNRRKCGEEYWEYEVITPIKDEHDKVISFITVKEDISERKRQEEELRLLATAFETGQATLIANAEMRIERVNQAFVNITGYTADEVVGHTPRMFKSGRHDASFYAGLWQSLTVKGHWQGEIWNRNKRGEIYPVWQSITAVKGENGEVRHYVSVFHNIAERKQVEQALVHEASRDHLTGAANRRAFDRALITAVRLAEKEGGEFAVMLFDIDHFKAVNDTHGHDVGDAVLFALTDCVQRRLRKTDLLARWGGEEFTLLLSGTPLNGALQLAERLRSDVAGAELPGAAVTISIGLTLYQPGDTARDLLMRADRALYRAKQGGRNRVELITGERSTALVAVANDRVEA